MASGQRSTIFHHLRRLVGACAATEAADEQLLGRFLAGRDEAAFAALVQRYGPLVLGVCRRVLHEPADVEDAFQATFLILVRKASGLREPRLLGPWLYGVAYRVAVRARASAARRRHHERQAPARPDAAPDTRADWRELRPLLDAEVGRLPERYRLPFVLCQLEGKTTEEAARCLGCPRGTVLSRLARARERLRDGLARRGLALSAALLTAELAREAEAAVPVPLATATARTALRFLTHPAGAAPTPAVALAQGVMKTMFLTRLKTLAVLLLALAALGTATGVLAHHTLAPKQQGEPPIQTAAAAPDSAPKGANAPAERATTDRFGDPLPPGALARLGRLRLRHGGPVAAIAFSPDGRLLASAGGDERDRDHKREQAICLWQADTGKEIAHLRVPGWNIWALAFSSDGKTLAATSTQGAGVHAVGTLTLWDVATGKRLQQLPSARRSMTQLPLAFSPDGKQVAANGDDGVLRLWDVATGREDPRVKISFRASALAYSPKGDSLAAGGWDGTVHRFDTATGKELSAWPGHPRWLRSLAFSADGKVLASLGVFGSVHLWRTDTGKEISLPGRGLGPVASLACSPTGSLLAVLETPAVQTGAQSQVVRLWDLKDGASLAGEFPLSERKADSPEGPLETLIGCISFSPDGKALAVAGRGGAIRLWNMSKRRPRTWPAGHQEAVRAFAYARDGRTLVTCGDDRTVRFWDPTSGKELRVFDTEAAVTALALSPDGRRLATAGEDGTVAVRDAATGRVLVRITPTDDRLPSARRTVAALAFAADGRTLNVATAYVQETRHILGPTRALLVGAWDVKTAEPVHKATALWGRGFVSRSHCTFAADGQTLAVCAGGQAFLMDAASGKQTALPEYREGVPAALALSGDTGLLALGVERQVARSREKTAAVLLWKKGGTPARPAPKGDYTTFQSLPGEITALTLSADGKLLASAREESGSRIIQVWDVATGKECGHFEGHRDRVTALGFSPDGKTLASASADATVLLWQVRADAAPRKP